MPNEMTPLEAAEIIMSPSRYGTHERNAAECVASSALQKIAAGEYKPVVHAHWIHRPFPHIDGELRCSRCNGIFGALLERYDYCPSCGALMDGKDDSHAKENT